jgi:peptidoglycan hydrolase-like protein with peptidoglycan-binding domain
LRFIIATLMAALLATALAARGLAAQDATAAKKSSVSKAKASSKSGKRTTSTKAGASKAATPPATSTTKSVAHRKPSKTTKKPVVVSRRYAQQTPSVQRYKEIQQALAERGYFRGEPDGTWGPESIDSLKRFQRDQSLAEDGKIGSLSLIALGLGPKRPAPEPVATQNQ